MPSLDLALVVAMVLVVAVLAAVAWRPELAAMGLGVFLFFQSGIVRTGGLPEQIQELVGRLDEVVLLGLLLRVGAVRLLRGGLHVPAPVWAMAGLAGVGLVSTLVNGVHPVGGAVGTYLAVKSGMWVLVAANLHHDTRTLVRYMTVIGALFVVASGVAVIQFAGVTMPWDASVRRSGEMAATSIWNQHTVFGSSIAVAAGLAVVALRLPGARMQALVLLAASGIGIILSSVRRLLISLPVGAIVAVAALGGEERSRVLRFARRREVLLVAAVILIVGAVVLAPRMARIAVDTWDEYVVNADERDRYVLYGGAFRLAAESPLVGRGPSTFGSYASVLFDSPAYAELGIALPDSLKMGAPYAMLLGEYGLLGILAFASFVALLFRGLLPIARAPDNILAAALATGGIFMISSMALEMVVHQVFSDSFVSFFVFGGVGTAFGLAGRAERPREEPSRIAVVTGDRRWAAISGGIAALLIVTLTGTVAIAQSPLLADNRPNVIVIMVDDLDLPLFEYLAEVERPEGAPATTIQELIGASGATFENAFVVDPLCCPSRVSMLRGQYAHSHGVWQNEPPSAYPLFEAELEASTLATWLQASGYRTGLVGKYMNGYGDDLLEPAGSPSRIQPVPPGWDRASWRALWGTPSYLKPRFNNAGQVTGRGSDEDDYQTDLLATMATNVALQRDTRPLFLMVTPIAPHNGRPVDGFGLRRDPTGKLPIPAARHASLYDSIEIPYPSSFLEEDVRDKPRWVRNEAARLLRTPADEREVYTTLYRERMATMAAVEDLVALLVANLGDELDNTYIFFTSDNGWHAGEHHLPPDKRTPYEEDVRVPLLVRGPGIAPGTSLPQLVTNLDLTATILDIAGAEAGIAQEGRSLLPLLTGAPPGEWRTAFLMEYEAAERDGLPSWSGVRTEQYSYVEWADGEVELYDLEADPFQLENRAADEPIEIRRLATIHDALLECAGADCFYTGSP